jgi:hypothetical protein
MTIKELLSVQKLLFVQNQILNGRVGGGRKDESDPYGPKKPGSGKKKDIPKKAVEAEILSNEE